MGMLGKPFWLTLIFITIVSSVLYLWSLPFRTGVEAQHSVPLDVERFLEQHWARPMEPLGSDIGGHATPTLGAASCGGCHPQQHADWMGSRHRQAMAAGILWQFHVYDQNPANACMDCHAPLAEQKALVAIDRDWNHRPRGALPNYVTPDLHLQGLTCAACHLRSSGVYGPPSRTGITGHEKDLPHGGFTPHEAFTDSRFCASCHQFPEDGPRLNGKLRQDTHNEWLQSEFATQGVGCQQCHMPDRQHLWRGIADRDTLASALAIELVEADDGDGATQIRLVLTNHGAGHRLPTYLVPRIDIEAVWVDATGHEWGPVIQHVLQWRASLDLSVEHFDHRLAPGETRVLTAELLPPLQATAMRMRVIVAPKEHYQRVYVDMLRQAEQMSDELLRLLRQALQETAASTYVLVDEYIPLDGRPIHWRFTP